MPSYSYRSNRFQCYELFMNLFRNSRARLRSRAVLFIYALDSARLSFFFLPSTHNPLCLSRSLSLDLAYGSVSRKFYHCEMEKCERESVGDERLRKSLLKPIAHTVSRNEVFIYFLFESLERGSAGACRTSKWIREAKGFALQRPINYSGPSA